MIKIKHRAFLALWCLWQRRPSKMTTTISINDITFYKSDEEGNILRNDKGEEMIFRLKEGLRFKPLEYLVEDFEDDMLEEVKEGI